MLSSDSPDFYTWFGFHHSFLSFIRFPSETISFSWKLHFKSFFLFCPRALQSFCFATDRCAAICHKFWLSHCITALFLLHLIPKDLNDLSQHVFRCIWFLPSQASSSYSYLFRTIHSDPTYRLSKNFVTGVTLFGFQATHQPFSEDPGCCLNSFCLF